MRVLRLDIVGVCVRRALLCCASSQTLYDQLEANKAKWQEDYDENTKKIFAPPKALDEDDVQFFDEQHATQLEKERRKKEQELVGLLDFKTAQVWCGFFFFFCTDGRKCVRFFARSWLLRSPLRR
jgi:hypothetical protein